MQQVTIVYAVGDAQTTARMSACVQNGSLIMSQQILSNFPHNAQQLQQLQVVWQKTLNIGNLVQQHYQDEEEEANSMSMCSALVVQHNCDQVILSNAMRQLFNQLYFVCSVSLSIGESQATLSNLATSHPRDLYLEDMDYEDIFSVYNDVLNSTEELRTLIIQEHFADSQQPWFQNITMASDDIPTNYDNLSDYAQPQQIIMNQLDGNAILEDGDYCSICFMDFTNPNSDPIQTVCNHVFCRACIVQVPNYLCPLCRHLLF